MEEKKSLLDQMKEALSAAKKNIVDMGKQINSMSSTPNAVGIVLKVNKIDPKQMYAIGTNVVCVRGNHQGQTGVVGLDVTGRNKGGRIAAEDRTEGYKVGVHLLKNKDGRNLFWPQDVIFPVLEYDPMQDAYVLMRDPDIIPLFPKRSWALVTVDGKEMEIEYPIHIAIRPGDVVRMHLGMMGAGILDTITEYAPKGESAIFQKMVGDMAEVVLHGDSRTVYLGKHRPTSLHQGDNLIVDTSGTVILQNLGHDEKAYAIEGEVRVTWEQVGGLEKAKAVLKEAITLPITHADLHRAYGKQPIKGAVLTGTPGNGKTLLAKAVATEMAALYKTKGALPFISIKGPEIMSKYVSVAEETLRGIFARARRYQQENNAPMVIFIDEAETLLPKRGSGISSDARDTIVATFLAEMDGTSSNGAFVLLATNRIDMLDPGVIRDGRCGRIIEVARPSLDDAASILNIHLAKKPINRETTAKQMADAVATAIYEDHFKVDDKRYLHEVVSGAMLEGIVQRAIGIAMTRDMAKAKPTVSGICHDDMMAAVYQVVEEQNNLNHDGFGGKHGRT
jgi:proteasome-associated ATPase